MSHLEFHPHAFIDANNIVINIAVFNESDHNEEIINDACLLNGGIQAVCCCIFGMATVGATWTGTKFIPVAPYKSWIWNDKLNVWEPPITQPTNGIYTWNEETISWDLIELFEENPVT
jgi:hypothetical protein